MSLHGRGEYATGDVDSGFTGSGTAPSNLPIGNAFFAFTATAQYDLWQNVLSRIEFRWDHAEHGNAFGGTTSGTPTRANAFMLAANVIYKF